MFSVHINIPFGKHRLYTKDDAVLSHRCLSHLILRTIKRVKQITTPFEVYNYVYTKETSVPVTSVY